MRVWTERDFTPELKQELGTEGMAEFLAFHNRMNALKGENFLSEMIEGMDLFSRLSEMIEGMDLFSRLSWSRPPSKTVVEELPIYRTVVIGRSAEAKEIKYTLSREFPLFIEDIGRLYLYHETYGQFAGSVPCNAFLKDFRFAKIYSGGSYQFQVTVCFYKP